MVFDLPWPVLSRPRTPCRWPSSSCAACTAVVEKVTQPIVRMIPQAHAPACRRQGGGRLRASFSAKRRHRTAYSSLSFSPAELVRHCDDQFKNRADFPRTLARCFALCHVFPVLVLVRMPMSMVGVFYVSGTDQLTEAGSLGPNGATSFPVQRRPLPLVSPPACWTSPESLAGTESPSPVRPSAPVHTAASPIWHRPQERQR